MEPEILTRFTELEEKINKIYVSVEKTRKYFLWTLIISVVMVVLPGILLAFAIPYFLSSYVGGIQNATNLIQ
jgi:type IV secretory pathway component VirB8